MVQIKSITEARKNLPQLVKQVAQTKETIIIVQNSIPVAEIVPFGEKSERRIKVEEWWDELERVLMKGKKLV